MTFFLFRLPLLLLSQGATFVYPTYASYKAITAPSRPGSRTGSYSWSLDPHRRDTSQDVGATEGAVTEMAELETWLMYWSVVGCMGVVESTAEWTWSWIPFYYELKLLFVLWLVLPKTRGATLIYTTYLAPFLAEHENDIDVALIEAKARAKRAGADWAQRAWEVAREKVWGVVLSQYSATQNNLGPEPNTAAPPPTAHNPAQGPSAALLSTAGGLLRTYGPMALAGATAALDRATSGGNTAAIATSTDRSAHSQAPSVLKSARNTYSRTEAARRRAELERQLAELDAVSGSGTASGTSSDRDETIDSLDVPFSSRGRGRSSSTQNASQTGPSRLRKKKSSTEAASASASMGISPSSSYDLLDQFDFSGASGSRSRSGSGGGGASSSTEETARTDLPRPPAQGNVAGSTATPNKENWSTWLWRGSPSSANANTTATAGSRDRRKAD